MTLRIIHDTTRGWSTTAILSTILPDGIGQEPGAGDIDIPEDDLFSRKFVVVGRRDPIRLLFDSDLRQHLMGFADSGTTIEAQGDTLLVAAPQVLLPRNARDLIQQTRDLFDLLVARRAMA